MEITIKSFEKYGYKLALESQIKDGEPTEFTFNRKIDNTDWYYCLVWHKDINKLTASTHNTDTYNLKFNRIFQIKVSNEQELELILEQHNLVNQENVIENNKEKEDHKTDFKLVKVKRVEVIDHSKSAEEGGGRMFVKRDCIEVELSYQDDGKTLKLFVK